jgi:hypothetical protein
MKRGTAHHPKVADLAARLDKPKYAAVGILELLWHFTAQFTPAGDIGKYSDAAIADPIGWKDDPTALINALVAAKWLDIDPTYRLIVHDWWAHCEDSVHIALARQTMLFAQTHKERTENAQKAFPVLSRLARDERAEIMRQYRVRFPELFSSDADNVSSSATKDLSQNALETHKKRTALPSHALPSHASSSSGLSAVERKKLEVSSGILKEVTA